jgi:hypothetical protein
MKYAKRENYIKKIFSAKLKKDIIQKTEGQIELIWHLVYLTTFLHYSKLLVIHQVRGMSSSSYMILPAEWEMNEEDSFHVTFTPSLYFTYFPFLFQSQNNVPSL